MKITTQIRARMLALVGLLLGVSGWFFWPSSSVQTGRTTIHRESKRTHAPAEIPNRTSRQGHLLPDHSKLSAILELLSASEHKVPRLPPIGAEWLQEDDIVLAGFSRWVDDFQLASPDQQARMLPDGLEQALVRREVMAALIATDPAKAIASAVPSHLRGGLPPAFEDLLEHRVTGVGDLEVIGILRDTERMRFSPRVERNVLINNRRYQAYVHDAMETLGTSGGVLMDGIALDNQLALTSQPGHWLGPDEPLDPAKDLIAKHPLNASTGFVELGDKIYCDCCFIHTAAAPGRNAGDDDGTAAAISRAYANLGSRTMLLIPVEFQDTTGSPWSSSSIQTDRTDKLKSYCNTVSFGKLTLATTVSPLQQVDQNASYYTQTHDGKQGYTVLSEHATAKANTAGYDHNTYDFACVVINHNLYSGWSGRGQLGDRISWVDGSISGQDQAEEVYIHEIGHNFGIWHANAWDPNTLVPDDSDGTHVEYGFDFDAMGDFWSYNHDQLHYNASFKNALDWLPSGQITDISATATLTLHAMDRTLVAGRTYAIRIPTSFTLGSNSNLDYWIEARSRYPSVSSVDNGVLLYVTNSSHTDKALKLLDMAPATSSVNDAGLTVGSSFTTKDSKWKITVNSVSGSGADRAFSITVADARPPSITTQPSDVSVTVDGAATFSVTATGSADESLQYQWHKDSIAIAGATSATYTISNSVLGDAGIYHVVVTNSYGTATSNSVTLTVNEDTGGGGGGCGSMPPVNLLLFISFTLLANRILLSLHLRKPPREPFPDELPGLDSFNPEALPPRLKTPVGAS